MLVVSLIPDQVISGAASLPGYNLQKMTTMVRFWSSSAVGAVSCRYVGLDGGDRAALATATTTLGCPVAPSDGSEETLAKRFYGLSDDAADRLIAWYDAAMAAQYGGEYSYGQSGNAKHSAIEIAQANSDLLALHMRRLADLRRQAAEPAALEKARFDYAAALDTREQVGFRPPAPANYHDSAAADYAELASAGDAARASGADYSGSCPAGTNAPTSTAETLAQMGMTVRRNVHGECPYCRRQTTFDPCRPQCGECGSTPGHDRSRSLEKQKQKMVKKQQEAKRVMAKKAADNGVNYDDLRAVYRTFGGVEKLISRKTNQVVAVGRQANRIWNEKPGFFS
jgi:hypothetical protein